MRQRRFVPVVLLFSVLPFLSCTRDPNVVKKRYLESGNKYFDRGKYKEASLMYRNALKKDLRYGPAYYKLALTQLKLNDAVQAVAALRRAVELLPPDQPDHWDAVVKLSDLYMSLGARENPLQDIVQEYCNALLKRDPNSFDGHRLTGDLDYAKALIALSANRKDEGKALVAAAIEEYRKADAAKPGEEGMTLSLARAYLAEGDYANAENLYRAAIGKNKTQQLAYTELYQLYMFQRKPDDGERILKLAFQNNPQQYGYLTLLAAHYFGTKRRDQMAGVLDQIKSNAKEYDGAYLTVGDFYLRVGDGDSAIREYREGIDKDAKKKAAYRKRIIEVLMRQGKRSEAAQLNAALLKENPKDNDAQNLEASLMLDRGDVNQALGELQGVVTRTPENPIARYNLGRAHVARGEWEQARQQFQKAIELRPDYLLARIALAELEMKRAEYDAALKTTQQILAIDPGNLNARLIESAALLGQRKFGDSRQVLDSMIRTNPSSPDVLFQIGVVNLAENKYKEAQDAFERAYQLNPANSRGLMGVVETYMAQNKTDQALQVLRKEAIEAPARLDIRVALGNTAARAGKFDAALEEFQKVLPSLEKGSKAQGEIYLKIGEVYRRQGDFNSAVAALQKAREVSPDNELVLGTLGLALDKSGRAVEAQRAYEAAIKLDPNNGIALNNLAMLIADTGGDLDDALTKAQRAKQFLPSMDEVSDTLGWIYLKKNLADSAIDVFQNLVVKSPEHSTYHYHLALALSQKGDKTRALKELQEALKYSPEKDQRQKIEDLINRLG